MTDQNNQKIVLQKINSGAIQMRPKFYFILQSIILIVFAIILLLITIFLISFVFFIMNDQVMAQHSIGVRFFLSVFPYIPTLLALLITFVAATLLKKFHFGYAHPFLYLLIGIIAISILVSIFVRATTFHQKLSCFARTHNTPVFTNLYQEYHLHELCENQQGLQEPY